MQLRRKADLSVDHTLFGDVFDQLFGDPCQGFLILHDLQWRIEHLQIFIDTAGAGTFFHPCLIALQGIGRHLYTLFLNEFPYGGGAEGSVQMQVKVDFRE